MLLLIDLPFLFILKNVIPFLLQGLKPLVSMESPALIFGTPTKIASEKPAAVEYLGKNKVPDLQKLFQVRRNRVEHLFGDSAPEYKLWGTTEEGDLEESLANNFTSDLFYLLNLDLECVHIADFHLLSPFSPPPKPAIFVLHMQQTYV